MAIPLTVDSGDDILTAEVNNFDPHAVTTTMNDTICDHNGEDIVDETGGLIGTTLDFTVHCERLTVQEEDTVLSVEVD
jgi:hypothetical protein